MSVQDLAQSILVDIADLLRKGAQVRLPAIRCWMALLTFPYAPTLMKEEAATRRPPPAATQPPTRSVDLAAGMHQALGKVPRGGA
jgi:hypothetical protein